MKKKIEIEIGVPIPDDMRGRMEPMYPIRALEVGQSFFAPNRKGGGIQQVLSASISINIKRHFTELVDGVKVKTREFTTRKVPGGARVWRVK